MNIESNEIGKSHQQSLTQQKKKKKKKSYLISFSVFNLKKKIKRLKKFRERTSPGGWRKKIEGCALEGRGRRRLLIDCHTQTRCACGCD